MGNPHRGDLDVDIQGVSYTLCYDLNACAILMEELGLTSLQQLTDGDAMSEVDMKGIIGVLWAGFNRHHPDMSREDVGALDWDIETIGETMRDAIQRGLVRQGGARGKKAGRGRTKSGTGT